MSNSKGADTSASANETIIHIDASYYIFYRFYAILQWWKVAKKDELLDKPLDDPIDNEEFVEKFRSTFISKLKEIPKKCGLNVKKDKITMVVARDCNRSNIWRKEIYPEYKQTRDHSNFKGKLFFKMAYDDNLFEKAGITTIYYHPKLEADDCIALSVKKILETSNNNCIIIGSDHDYLQLVNDRVKIINLKYKNVADGKNVSHDAKKNLFVKIVMGDVSDNIPGIFPKCGIITANKCYDNKEYFEKKQTSESYRLFERNNKIINFDYIPQHLISEFHLQF